MLLRLVQVFLPYGNRPQYLEALEPGHFYVEKQKVRPELFDLLNRLEALLSLADHATSG
jgi:hypothetical protein